VRTLVAAACLGIAGQALADNVVLSCMVTETAVNHAQRTFDLTVDQTNQLVYVRKTISTAAITESRITFRVDLGTGVPFTFAIDRASGAIRVSGATGPLYNGQCKSADAAHASPEKG
jgi:hypothetical protein